MSKEYYQTTFTPPKEKYVIPCRYMKFSLDGYHRCLAAPSHGDYCVCEYFFDAVGFSSIKKLNEAKNNVDKACPKRYSYEEIVIMIQPLNNCVNWKRRPHRRLNKKQREREQKINAELQEIYKEMAR